MALELENVSVSRGGATILKSISTLLGAKGIVGLVGPNGTGKTTLLDAIATLSPFKGTIHWEGEPVDIGKIGYLPQQCQVRADLSVIETMLLGRHEHLGWHIGDDVLVPAIQVLENFGLHGLHARKMQTLSGGQQQLVLLAQRMLREPKLLLLDEATSALDIRHQMQVFQILRAYVERAGALVVMAVHDLNLAGRYCDHLLLLNGGSLVNEGPFETVITSQTLRDIYGVEAEFLASGTGKPVVLPLRTYGTDEISRPN